MTFRLAKAEDLPELKEMYRNIILNMYKINLCIWNEVYPYEVLVEDFEAEKLYVLVDDGGELVSAMAINGTNDGENFVEWENKNAKAVYLDRLGVNPNFANKGIGTIMVNHAIEVAKSKNAEFLRLFIVDTNKPAEHLYLKNDFKIVSGAYIGCVDGETKLTELGFELKIKI